MDIVFSVVSKILEPIVASVTDAINTRIGYVSQYQRYVDKLDSQVGLLEEARDDLQCSIEDAGKRVENVKKHVSEWKEQADTLIKEARALVPKREEGALVPDEEEGAQRGCCLRLRTRYRISKKAEERTKGITQLLEKKEKWDGPIAHPCDLPQPVRPVPVEGYEAQSRTKILKEVMDALLDPNITRVGVYGTGGIGKTTLAEEIQRQATSFSFDQVIIVSVTATPEVKRIQDTIAGVFPQSKLEDCTDDTRPNKLHQILKDRKVLIIMDDLWSSLELDKVGIPSWNDNKGCKILLTSRYEHILSDMGSQKNFRLQFLSAEESRSLFEKKVEGFDHPEIAEQILEKCDGFPLLIVTVGGHLKEKDSDVWKNTLTQLSMFDDGEAVKKVQSVLESSYDNLDDHVTKQMFLLFSVSSQSDTTMLNLLRYGMGMGFFENRTVCQAWYSFKTLIGKLKDCSLLDVDKQGNLKMHDIVRETAVRIASRKNYFRERDDRILTEWPSRCDISRCKAVFIPHSIDIRQLPEDLGCPDVELLLLFCNRHSVDIPDTTFEWTKKLKVIHFAKMKLASLPIKSSHSLTNLHTLCLEDCQLKDLTTITRLETLEILSFRGSDLKELPSEIGNLTSMKVLDLSDCSELRFIPVGVISKLTSLEELLMRNSFKNWEVEKGTNGSNAKLSELKFLARLQSLVIHVPDTRALSKEYFFDHLERFQILIGSKLEFDHRSEITKTLKLDVDMSTDLLQKVRELLGESEILYLSGNKRSTIHLYDLEKKGFPNLKKLHVTCYWDLQQVVDCRKLGPTVCFPLLESLKLEYLANMVTICQGRPAPESFSQMKRLKIYDCFNLENLFPLSAVQSLPQLEEIEVSSCPSMEALFVAASDCGDKGYEVVEFPRLRLLNFDMMPSLKCFLYAKENPIELGSSENAGEELTPFFSEKVTLPSLETLKMNTTDNIEMIWCSQLRSSTFDKLNSLEIESCHKLKSVFSSGSIERFQNLKSLKVSRCYALEDIYQFGDGVADDPMTFGLNQMYLSELSRLKRVWKEDSTYRYHSLQNLESISISDCESLENIFPLAVAKTLSQLKSIEVRRCEELKEIVAEEKEIEISNVDQPCSLFPVLTSLTIQGCPKANIFGGGQPHCPNQQPFFSLEKVVPKLKEMCIDGRIFKSMSSEYLTGLESLTLSLIRGETSVEVSQLENMFLLRKLAIWDSRITKLWTSGIDKPSSVRIVELHNVHRLRHVCRPDSQMDPLLRDIEFMDLYMCHDLISLAPSPSASFWSLSTLFLFNCSKLTDLVNPATASTMANLVTLSIWCCSALKEIVVATEQQDDQTTRETIVFKKLKTLTLRSLHSLHGFCISGSYSFEFPCLEVVSVNDCPSMTLFCNGDVSTPKLHNVGSLLLWERDLNTIIKLQYEDGLQSIVALKLSRFPKLVESWGRELPFKRFSRIDVLMVDQLPPLLPVAVPSNVLPALSGLCELAVEKCDSVEEIFDLDGMDHQNEDHVHLMSTLSQLRLSELPKLKHVWNEDPLEILGLKNLSELKVHNCGNLTHIFTLPMALGLVHLRRLYVTGCPLLKVIIKEQSDGQPPADWVCRPIFPSLNLMQLKNLPNLMEFFSGNDVLRSPNLAKVWVEGCPRICLSGSVALLTEKDNNIIVQRHKDRSCDGDVHEPAWRILNKQVEISRLEELTIEWNSSLGNAWHETVPQSVLHSLEVIKLTGFLAHHELLPSDFIQGMPSLHRLTVVDSFCEQILPPGPSSVSEIQPAISFKRLTHFQLFNLPELSHLIEEDSQSGSLFQHLKILKVSKCKRLTRLVTYITAKGLVNLEELAVEECERMTEIVSSNGYEVGDEIVFEKLESLKLHGLPCLASFTSGNCAFSSPHLKKLEVSKCKRLTRLLTYITAKGLVNLEELSVEECERMTEVVSSNGDEIVFEKLESLKLRCLPCLASFSSGNCAFSSAHLKKLNVSKCKRLTRLVTYITAKGLLNLEELAVEECERLMEVVSSNGDEVGVEIVFGKLKSLVLHGLPCFASFSSGNCVFSFPRLDEVVVRECPNMKTFAKNAPCTPKLDYVQIAGEEEGVDPWRWVEDGINGTIEKLFAEKN